MDFNPRPPRGGRRAEKLFVDKCSGISIHAPREGGDFSDYQRLSHKNHFNPRPPRGGRRGSYATVNLWAAFQSTPPARGATAGAAGEPPGVSTISIHAPREGGDVCVCVISIHAPREGGDLDFFGTILDFVISIHAPREGGDAT